ncbi:MAG: glycosyltransferase family 4 protein [Chitinispirillaceae bacterium]|nr:glycosyltransferase family 4 protein [Chitinispirillaceae bacterium]
MKKILLINWRDIKNPEAGGAEMYYHEIFRRLEGRGYQTTVLSHMFSGAPKEEIIDGMRTVRIGSKFLFNFSAIAYVNKHQNEYDCIIEDINKVPFLTPLYTKKKRLHMVMHFFKGSIFSETMFPLALYIYCMEHCVPLFYKNDRFIAISGSTSDEIIDFGIDRKRISIVEPGIDTTYFKQTVPKGNPPVISYVGRLMKYKNIQFIISALPKLREMVPGVVFEVGGWGDYRSELEQLAQRLGVGDAVKFLGRISEEEKRDMLSRSTLFVNPSLKEGWGINNIEANLCRTISLSNNVPGLKDSVIDNVTGLLYENSNIDDFCKKAYSALTDKNLLRRLEEKAYERALSLDWDSIAKRMEEVLKSSV